MPHDKHAERLGRAIDTYATSIGMGRPVLAERAMVSQPYLSEIARGVKAPRKEVVRRIAVAMGLPSEHALYDLAATMPVRYDAPGFGPVAACPSGRHIAEAMCGCCSHCGQPYGH